MFEVETKLEEAIVLYRQGVPMSKISEQLGVSPGYISKILRTSGIQLRTQSEQQLINNGNTSLKQNAFKILTPETLYWLGFIYADGCLMERYGRYLLTIDLSTEDELHIEKFKTFLSASNQICRQVRKRGDKEYHTSYIRIASKEIFEDICTLGIIPNKTYEGTVSDTLKESVDFWRGVIDGDGCLSNKYGNKKYPAKGIGLCGTYNIIQSFIDFVKLNNILIGANNPRPFKSTPHIFQTAMVGKCAPKIADLLYKDATVYLDRKYKIYQEWKEDLEISL